MRLFNFNFNLNLSLSFKFYWTLVYYYKKLIEKCERYRGLANFYYIFDEHNLLDKKDAPCDKGQEVLEQLMKRRIAIK